MKVDAVHKGTGNAATSHQIWPWIQACCREGEGYEWERDEEQWEEEGRGQVEEVQKGTGKGIPFHGKLLQLRQMGTFSQELPSTGKGIQREVLCVGSARTLSQVLSERQRKREVERERYGADEVGMGTRKRRCKGSEV